MFGRSVAQRQAGVVMLALTVLQICHPSFGPTATPRYRVTPSPAVKITIDRVAFEPATVYVPPDTPVTWTNLDDVPHTVTATIRMNDGPLFDSGKLARDQTFTQRSLPSGTWAYTCEVHPWMTGTLVVLSPDGSLPSDTPPATPVAAASARLERRLGSPPRIARSAS